MYLEVEQTVIKGNFQNMFKGTRLSVKDANRCWKPIIMLLNVQKGRCEITAFSHRPMGDGVK